MTLLEQISQDLTTAMKARDEARVSVLRMAKSALKNKEIDKRAPLDDAESLKVMQVLVKQREDSIQQFTAAGRTELADKEKAEAVLLKTYLPQGVSEADIAAAVEQAIAETGASSVKDMGKVMKAVLVILQATGKPADGKLVNDAVRKRLAG
jgi:uncharacterized protein